MPSGYPSAWKLDLVEVIAKTLMKNARRTLGKGKTVEIRATKLPTEKPQISWYTNSSIVNTKALGLTSPTFCPSGGFMYCGRLRT